MIQILKGNQVECRPIVAGDLLENKAIEYFNYEVYGDVKNAEYFHKNGLFIGNYHIDCTEELTKIYEIIRKLER